MTYKLKVSSQNQITLPVSLVTELNIKAGQFIEIVKVNGRYTIQTFRDVLDDLNTITKNLQVKVQNLKKEDPNFDIDRLVDEETKAAFAKL